MERGLMEPLAGLADLSGVKDHASAKRRHQPGEIEEEEGYASSKHYQTPLSYLPQFAAATSTPVLPQLHAQGL